MEIWDGLGSTSLNISYPEGDKLQNWRYRSRGRLGEHQDQWKGARSSSFWDVCWMSPRWGKWKWGEHRDTGGPRSFLHWTSQRTHTLAPKEESVTMTRSKMKLSKASNRMKLYHPCGMHFQVVGRATNNLWPERCCCPLKPLRVHKLVLLNVWMDRKLVSFFLSLLCIYIFIHISCISYCFLYV